jgi:hypothetical protein
MPPSTIPRSFPSKYYWKAISKFASTHLGLYETRLIKCFLSRPSVSLLAKVASAIRGAINSVTHDFVKKRLELLSLANFGTLDINMNASNHGPDMYITSWAKMCIDADFGGPLGRPQYVRKPWEPNEGANIVLPRCWERDSGGVKESQAWEVFVQTAEDDRERLLGPDGLEKWAERVV